MKNYIGFDTRPDDWGVRAKTIINQTKHLPRKYGQNDCAQVVLKLISAYGKVAPMPELVNGYSSNDEGMSLVSTNFSSVSEYLDSVACCRISEQETRLGDVGIIEHTESGLVLFIYTAKGKKYTYSKYGLVVSNHTPKSIWRL